jgi:hypothetical protein
VLLEGTQHFSYQPGRYRQILGFEWINSGLCDLAVVTNSDIQFLKFNESRNKLVHVKSVSCATSKYWAEDGVLVAAAPTPGLLSVFYLNQVKGLKYFAGPKFTLDLEPARVEDWASSYAGRLQSRESLPHKVLLCRLYEGHYFVQMNCLKGECHLYAIGDNSVQLQSSVLCANPGDYELSCSDNLLLMTNLSLPETYVFDIRSDTFEGVAFCTIVHRPQPVEELSVSVLARLDGSVDFSFIYTEQADETGFEVLPTDAHVVYSELPEETLQFVSQNICVTSRTCYQLGVECESLVKTHPDRLEACLFLLRRTGYKVKAYEYIRKAIREHVPLLGLSRFFETVSITYNVALSERKSSRYKGGTADLKIETGMTVLLQADLYNFVFTPLFEDKSVDNAFLAAAVAEYMRSLAEQSIAVHMSLQILLTRLLIRGKDFVSLLQMVQYHVFDDSLELAQAFLVLSNPANPVHFPPAYQLGIDMLTRLKEARHLAKALADRHLYVEALRIYPADIAERLREAPEMQDAEMQEPYAEESET